MMLQQYITQYVHAVWKYGQEALNISVPLTQTIYVNYEILSENYILFRIMPRDSPLLLYAKKHAKIQFHYGPITILYKYNTCYIL